MNTSLSAASIRDLVRADQVHKDLYLSPELFALEQREFFGNTWQFAGHVSQIPQPLDYITVDIAGQSLLLLRDNEGEVRALHNRCAHKGVRLYTAESGRLGARFLSRYDVVYDYSRGRIILEPRSAPPAAAP